MSRPGTRGRCEWQGFVGVLTIRKAASHSYHEGLQRGAPFSRTLVYIAWGAVCRVLSNTRRYRVHCRSQSTAKKTQPSSTSGRNERILQKEEELAVRIG
jgi:hypothetical protein